jgi:hypothetical protein
MAVLIQARMLGQDRESDAAHEAFRRLGEILIDVFPYGTETYPTGSFVSSELPNLSFALKKGSVAIRHAVQAIQLWETQRQPTDPDIAIAIDLVKDSDVSNLINRSTLESYYTIREHTPIRPGVVVASRQLTQDIDKSMMRFRWAQKIGENEYYYVDFLNPATIDDSSIAHALFIAQPDSASVRNRAVELLLVDYCVENGSIRAFSHLSRWAHDKSYPLPPESALKEILRLSAFFESDDTAGAEAKAWQLTEWANTLVQTSRSEYARAKEECVSTVRAEARKDPFLLNCANGVDWDSLIDTYLGAVFSEIRMMANYFRSTQEFFSAGKERFEKFDYIVKRAVNDACDKPDAWLAARTALLRGLTQSSMEENVYIASVFHNVLATYYLNRQSGTAAYQLELLKKRQVYFDTNVLYSLVPASNFYEVTSYVREKLRSLGIQIKLYPFTVREYEESLNWVCSEYERGDPNSVLALRNPWLLQEFKSHQAEYLNSIRVCANAHSFLEPGDLERIHELEESAFYDMVGTPVAQSGFQLDTDFVELDEEAAFEKWFDLRNMIPGNFWSQERYTDFISRSTEKSKAQIRHDVMCIENTREKAGTAGHDALGRRVFFVTADYRYLIRLRKQFPFIIDPYQLMDFLMPYLFLSDLPAQSPTEFPNQVLSTQIGSLLVAFEPTSKDLVRAFFVNPKLYQSAKGSAGPKADEIANILSAERFRRVTESLRKMKDVPEEVLDELGALVEEFREFKVREAENRDLRAEKEALERRLAEKEKENKKLINTNRYLRSHKRS